MKVSLQNRILLPTGAMIVVLVVIIAATTFVITQRSLSSTVLSQMTQICESTTRQVEDWVTAQKNNLIQLTVEPEVAEALSKEASANPTREKLNKTLQHAKQLYGYYEDLHLADTTGMTVASSNPGSIAKLSVADREYFKQAVTGKLVVSEVLQSRTTGNPIFVIAAPIKTGDQIQGVLYSVVDLNWFSSKYVANIKVMTTGYAFLFDDKGVFIAHPDKARILKTSIADFDWGKQVQERKNGLLAYTYEGAGKQAAFSTLPGLGWGCVVTAPTAELEASAYRIGKITVTIGIVCLLAGVVLMLMVSRSIARPLTRLADELLASSEQTASAADQVSAASQSLAEGSSEQAASLEETSSSLEEMSSMTRRNADNAEEAKNLSNQTRNAAETGAKDMHEMSQAMDAIKASSDNIAKIIKTIDEIAFQTNILALNAAVEAARAGEAGMGFAVVADEVRTLAQRSAKAAKETAEKIEDSISKSQNGVQISSKVAERLGEIVVKARRVDELVAEISSASKEQSQGISQVNTAVSEMDKVTQSNAANAEETASASQELNAQAAALKTSATELKSLMTGDRAMAAGRTIQEKPQSSAAAPRTSTVTTRSSFKTASATFKPAKGAPATASNEEFVDIVE